MGLQNGPYVHAHCRHGAETLQRVQIELWLDTICLSLPSFSIIFHFFLHSIFEWTAFIEIHKDFKSLGDQGCYWASKLFRWTSKPGRSRRQPASNSSRLRSGLATKKNVASTAIRQEPCVILKQFMHWYNQVVSSANQYLSCLHPKLEEMRGLSCFFSQSWGSRTTCQTHTPQESRGRSGAMRVTCWSPTLCEHSWN